jgi:hypothetical protein
MKNIIRVSKYSSQVYDLIRWYIGVQGIRLFLGAIFGFLRERKKIKAIHWLDIPFGAYYE